MRLDEADVRVLHVYKDFDPPVHGGIERHIALMCRYQREWADVAALTCSRTWRTRRVMRDGTPVTEVGEWGRFQSAPVAPAFPWQLRRDRADVVVVQVPNPTAEVSWLLARPRGKLVVRYQSDVVRQAAAMRVYGPVLMQFLAKADMILPTSQAYADTSSTLQPFRGRCRVVPLGIDPEAFVAPDAVRVQSTRERYGGRFVLFSGRHRYYKGLKYLVEAAQEIRVPVVIAGDGPERAALMAEAAWNNAAVHFPGALSDEELVTYLHACDVFAFPSTHRSEAFGISILEAHACAKPVVATRLGTGVELANLDGVTGLNVPAADAGALAEAVNRLLDDAALRERLGRQALERVNTEFKASEIARREFELYEEVVG